MNTDYELEFHHVMKNAHMYILPVFVSIVKGSKTTSMKDTCIEIVKQSTRSEIARKLRNKIERELRSDKNYIRCECTVGATGSGFVFDFKGSNIVRNIECSKSGTHVSIPIRSLHNRAFEYELSITPMFVTDLTFSPHGVSGILTIRRAGMQMPDVDEDMVVNLYTPWANMDSNFRYFAGDMIYESVNGRGKDGIIDDFQHELRFVDNYRLKYFTDLLGCLPRRLQYRANLG